MAGTTPNLEQSEKHHEPSRVLALSDGVVAIAITVLILPLAGIEVPQSVLDNNDVMGYLWTNYSQLIMSFLISWFVIIAYWFEHHRLFGSLRYVDDFIIRANMAWLLAVVVMPFPTNLLGQGKAGPVGTAVFLYLVTLAVTGGSLSLMKYHVDKHPELRDPVRPWYQKDWLGGLIVTGYILILAFLAPEIGAISLWALFGIFLLSFGLRKAGLGGTPLHKSATDKPLEEV